MLAIVAASHSHPKVAFAFICVIEIRGFWLLVPIQLFGQHDNGDDDDKMVMLPTTMVKKHKKKRALGIWTLRPATSLPIGLFGAGRSARTSLRDMGYVLVRPQPG